MAHTTFNVHPGEVAKFEALSARWWDTESEFKTLHDTNPLRLGYIEQKVGSLSGKKILDVGCGGGILSESLARKGARVMGIDMAEAALKVAHLHLYESGVQVDYRHTTVEQLAAEKPAVFDVVTCMEMLEHLPDPSSVIQACAHAVKPGGQVFFSTLNRNPKSYLFAIIGAEYLLQLLPKGTHDYAQFIRPSELAQWLRLAQLELKDLTGLHYNPLSRNYALGKDISVNYLVYAQRPF